MTLLRYVLIGIISVLLVACDGKVSVSGTTYDGSPITLTLGKTTFDEVYKTENFAPGYVSIPFGAQRFWKTLEGEYFKIPNVGEFDHILLFFNDDGVLATIRLEFIKNFIDTSLLRKTLANKYNEIPNITSYSTSHDYEYASGNGATILLRIGYGNYGSLAYGLDTAKNTMPIGPL